MNLIKIIRLVAALGLAHNFARLLAALDVHGVAVEGGPEPAHDEDGHRHLHHAEDEGEGVHLRSLRVHARGHYRACAGQEHVQNEQHEAF
eukprot:CAMPEP_0170467994 /NCGR_PEP_ID=MMETSP0123-20130129/11351_1 /TAXON_ID=182087 /ORGANISM="Favella ehrenbergii, Strain Fehren 1" /LENGTH=89 /DNA_ID=CAMNT_0010734473 /DNA_START=27 /DNA_END=297 /DNA_ORIENTATION=-